MKTDFFIRRGNLFTVFHIEIVAVGFHATDARRALCEGDCDAIEGPHKGGDAHYQNNDCFQYK